MPLYLGLDIGAHGLAAVVVEIDRDFRRVVFNRALTFDRDLFESDADVAEPLLWADALDRIFGRLAAAAEIEIEHLRAIGGSVDAVHDVDVPRAVIDNWPAIAPASALAHQLSYAFAAPYAAITTPMRASAYLEALVAGMDAAGHGETKQLAAHWQKRYSLPAAAIVPWTSSSQATVIGTGVIRDGIIGVSLGTSDIVFSRAAQLRFRNGALAREWMRVDQGLDWDQIAAMLQAVPGNDGGILLPWLEPEQTPRVAYPGLRRFGFDRHAVSSNMRGLIEGQMMAMANHAAAIVDAPIERVVATGPEVQHRAMLQVMANVFGAEVQAFATTSAAALGAALRAYHAERLASGEPVTWQSTVSGFADADRSGRVLPNPQAVALYAELRKDYARLEQLHMRRTAIC